MAENDPLKAYLRELGTISPLTKEEETDLLQRARIHDAEGELAFKRLVEANLRLVVSIAERHISSAIRMLDLIQEGNIGLFVALDTLPGSSCDSFQTHAANCIERAISKIIADSQSANE